MTQRLNNSQYTLADYFQIAHIEIPRVWKGFAPDRGSNLKSYAKLVLTNALKDLLRQRQAADVCSNWSLLRKVSKKRIGEVLLQRGITEPEASQYQLAWFCFKTLYTPSDSQGERLPEPKDSLWTEIVELYNSQRQQHLTPPGATLTATQIATRLTKLSEWTRAYLYPTLDSLNRSKTDEAGGGEVQDDLTDSSSESLLDIEIEREEIERRTSQQSQLQTILTQALANLSPELREVLQLFYRDGLSQQELSERLQTSQPTVSRRLKKAEEELLAALLTWIESQMNKFPDPNELKIISTNLKEWLSSHLGSE
jgi:RNA polymerase sigma factor (sigma-70 family)